MVSQCFICNIKGRDGSLEPIDPSILREIKIYQRKDQCTPLYHDGIVHIHDVSLWCARKHEDDARENHPQDGDERYWDAERTEVERTWLEIVCSKKSRAYREGVCDVEGCDTEGENGIGGGISGEGEETENDRPNAGEPDLI